MAQDYFAILGLAPGRYQPAEILRQFDAQRRDTLARLDNPAFHQQALARLEQLHVAYVTLSNPASQAEYLDTRFESDDDATAVRRLIESSLEDGLLRYSRRREILAEGQRRGFTDFQIQVLIAQVQFGGTPFPPERFVPGAVETHRQSRAWARIAAAVLLALVLFLILLRWFLV